MDLTKKEIEVLQLIIDHGYDMEGLAERLRVSANTIKAHKSQIFSKLYVNNITDAVVKAIRLKLVEV
jgi:DNA-binding NarL/FixJ family response regulator